MVAPPFPLWAWLVFAGLVLALLILAQGFGLQIPILASLLVIAAAIAVTIVASMIATRGGNHGEDGNTLAKAEQVWATRRARRTGANEETRTGMS